MIIKNKQNKKAIFLLILILPLMITLSVFMPARAGYNVPEDSPNNDWHWEVDEGDLIMFEIEQYYIDPAGMDVVIQFKNIWISNISDIRNETISWMGGLNEMSVIETHRLYENASTGLLEDSGNSLISAAFGYNSSDTIKEKFATQGFVPFVLPMNGTNGLQMDLLADILNRTLYYPMAQQGMFNYFDSYSYNIGQNSISFLNSTDGYFIDMSFYANNGTIKDSKFSLLFNFGGDPMLMNATTKRVFDYDITDEIEWGVEVGDELLYDFYEGSYYDTKFKITSIEKTTIFGKNWTVPQEEWPMTFEQVLADILTWNGTGWELEESDFRIGAANNFYPLYFDPENPQELMFVLAIPNSTTYEDLAFMWNNDTLPVLDYSFTFDDARIADNGVYGLLLSNYSYGAHLDSFFVKKTGILTNRSALIGSSIWYIEEKSQTLVDWDLEIGDTIHYKMASDIVQEHRAEIVASYGEYINMSMLEADSGGIFVKIPGQPEFQFFKLLIADIYDWDPETDTWIKSGSWELFLAANIYWPIAPFMIGGAVPPLFITKGSTGEDMGDLLFMMEDSYDEITLVPERVSFYNTSADREYNMYINVATGQVTFMGGWMPSFGGTGDWNWFAVYPRFYKNTSAGITTMDMPSTTVSNVEFTLTTNATHSGIEVMNSLLAFNPINVTLDVNSTILFYNDMLITNSTNLTSFTMYFKFNPAVIDLGVNEIFVWAFNMTGMNTWDSLPLNGTIDLADNSITIYVPIMGGEGPISVVFALSYISSTTAIPSYPPLTIVLISIISMFGIALIIKKRIKK